MFKFVDQKPSDPMITKKVTGQMRSGEVFFGVVYSDHTYTNALCGPCALMIVRSDGIHKVVCLSTGMEYRSGFVGVVEGVTPVVSLESS